jgi:hypothetical protein
MVWVLEAGRSESVKDAIWLFMKGIAWLGREKENLGSPWVGDHRFNSGRGVDL